MPKLIVESLSIPRRRASRKKLSLDVDALQVESFEAQPAAAGKGTVHGHSYPNQCDPPSDSLDPWLDTCQYATCAGDTCWQSCGGTCNCGGGSGGCGGGSAGCQPWLAAYTYCFGVPSCIEQCDPPTG